MFGRHISRALALGMAALVVEADAADQNSDSRYSVFALSLESPQPDSLIFRERFDFSFTHNVNDVFTDELHPLNVVKWNLDLRGTDFSDNFHNRISGRARSAFGKSIEYSLRDAVVEAPFMLWLDQNHGWFADLLRDSVDNVGEESLAPLDVSYRNTEQSWWKNLLSNGGTHYGVRPLRTSPYVYVSHAIKDGGDNTVVVANVRYYYEHFSEHRFELSLAVPLAYGMALDLGSAYEFGARDEQRFVVKLLKEFKGGGIAHLGLEVKDHPSIIAGISFGW